MFWLILTTTTATLEILSLYLSYHQRFPQHHELLLCNTDTSDEEVELFFYRAEHAIANEQPSETYTIVHPEKLSLQQQQLVRQLGKQTSGVVAILVSSSASGFFNLSQIPPQHVPTISPSILHNMVKQHLEANACQVQVYYSNLPGAGKSYHIKQMIPQSESVMYYNSSQLSQVLYNLAQANGNTIYIGISSQNSFGENSNDATWEEIDRFLFCLTILGIVSDKHNNIFFTQFDTKFFIEASNGTYSSAPVMEDTFLALLPQQLIDTNHLNLDENLQSLWKNTFGTKLTELIPSKPIIDALSATKFLKMALEQLLKSKGFTEARGKTKKIQNELLTFVERYFFQTETKKVNLGNEGPIITLGRKSNFKVVSVSAEPVPSSLPNLTMTGKSNQDLIEILHRIFTKKQPLDLHFVLTSDNLLKLALLKILVVSDIPVIFQGETGSGKTKLVECFGKLTEIPIHTLDMHGGIGEQDVIDFINTVTPKGMSILFFDEINTSPAGELIKELVCDKSCRGVPLNPNLRVLAACNPLVHIPHVPLVSGSLPPFLLPSGQSYDLKYNVRPLHATLEKYVWDFGTMSDSVEMECIY